MPNYLKIFDTDALRDCDLEISLGGYGLKVCRYGAVVARVPSEDLPRLGEALVAEEAGTEAHWTDEHLLSEIRWSIEWELKEATRRSLADALRAKLDTILLREDIEEMRSALDALGGS